MTTKKFDNRSNMKFKRQLLMAMKQFSIFFEVKSEEYFSDRI